INALTAAAIAFVAFEGWELLMFDQESINDPETTLWRAIQISIIGTTIIYILVAIVTTNLVPVSILQKHSETALAIAARPILGQLGFTLIAIAAVLSTASALNATLFSASRLSAQIAESTAREVHTQEDQTTVTNGGQKLSNYSQSTPTHRSSFSSSTMDQSSDTTPPIRTLGVIGMLTAIFTLYGSLNSITSFASGAFMTIFGLVSALAFTQRNDKLITAIVPAIGTIGSVAALVALVWHLHRTSPQVLMTVAVIWAVVLSVYWVPRK
ncbi:MAG: APC family permease, partial [Halobacteriaceae archaeon]